MNRSTFLRASPAFAAAAFLLALKTFCAFEKSSPLDADALALALALGFGRASSISVAIGCSSSFLVSVQPSPSELQSWIWGLFSHST